MKNLYLIILALLVGCTKQFSESDNALTITAISTDFDTKASETAFEAGDKLGIFLESSHGNNALYETADGSTWQGFGNIGEFKSGDNVIAYYPYSQTATNMNAIEVVGGVDFMICPKTPLQIVDNKASAALKFKHILSKLVAKMAMPEEIAGVKTASLESIVVKNVFRKGVIDITTEKISGLTDKGDLRSAGNSAIVIPQTVQKTKIVFKMANGKFDSLTYNDPILLESGKKTTFKAISNADLYFTSVLNLSSGDAQTDLPLSFYVAPGRTWTLTSSASWLTIEPKTGVGAATVKVNVAQNAGVPRTATITLTDDKKAPIYQKPMQNYIRTVTIAGTRWTTRNLTGTMQGQISNFTLAATPQDLGLFWKWGSVCAYNRESNGLPSGHWGGNSTGSGSYPNGDPCKSLGMYKTPTYVQWQALISANGGNSVWVILKTPGVDTGVGGRLFGIHNTVANATIFAVPLNCIFIPAAGMRDCYNGLLSGQNSQGWYWASSAFDNDESWYFYFDYNGNIYHKPDAWLGHGFSVRCVQE